MKKPDFDVVILGAGAAGMMCALTAAQRGRAVLLIDHFGKLGEKLRISGGGRCNFTNLDMKPDHFLSANPHFVRSALARYTPQHFLDLLHSHGLRWEEKAAGQLFSSAGSEAIIHLLKDECDSAGVRWRTPCEITGVRQEKDGGFCVDTARGQFRSPALVVATGGLSIPKIGASPFGYKLAEQFGLPVVKLKAGLVPLSFHPDEWRYYTDLAGVSVKAEVSFGKRTFTDEVLFTHRGLSGPAILQISSYWEPGQPLSIDFAPDHDLHALIAEHRQSKMLLANWLGQYLPKRLAEAWCQRHAQNLPVNQCTNKILAKLADELHQWRITPTGTLGYGKAEVTCGGVDTRAFSSQTMQANDIPGLYFIGEVLDVTGQLGGYNLHWAWASGHAAGTSI